MNLLRKLRLRLQRRRLERDLAEEMRLHRELLEDRLRGDGLTPAEARAAALRRFGNAAAALEQSRDQWGFVWLDSVLQDLRYAARALRRSKAFAVTAVLTLGVGLGLNTVLFTVFNAYVLRPFAVRDPYSLYEIGWTAKKIRNRSFSLREFRQLRERSDLFSDVHAVSYTLIPVQSHSLTGMLVSGNYFSMLGAGTLLGRPILPEDDAAPGAGPVVVISHEAWKAAFGQDPQILGRKLVLNGHPFEVIGVARPGFSGLRESPLDFWVPLSMFRELKPGQDLFGPAEPAHLVVVGRLRPDVATEQAAAALTGFMRQNASRLQEKPENLRASFYPRSSPVALTPELVKAFSPVFAAFVLVMIAACANVSNLMLARAAGRQREIGVRLSLGAGRARLVRQLLTESLLIAILAGLTGIALAQSTLELGQRLFFATLPSEFAKVVRLVPLALDYRVFLFVLAAATAATLLFGLVPSLQATRTVLVGALRGEFGGRLRASRLRDALVVSQVTVCLVLLVCAATLFRNSDTFQKRDVRLRVDGVVHVSTDDARIRRRAAEQLAAQPGVAGVAAVYHAPLYGRLRQITVTPSGAAEVVAAGYNFVSPEYFRLLEVPILRGRGFAPEESAAEAPVAIVSESTARRFWPGQDPLGKTIRVENLDRRYVDRLPEFTQVQVIGIARDVISGWVGDGLDPTCLYFPTSLAGKHARDLLARGRPGDPGFALALRAALSGRWPDAGFQIVPLEQPLAVQIYPFTAAAWIGWLLGAVALVLTVSGMYGVMAYLVSQRTKEVGIRIALGATPTMVLRLVMRHSVKLTCAGLAVGLALSLAASRLLIAAVELLKMVLWDPVAVVASLALVAAAALLAAYFPSRRASCLDPVSTLRFE